MAQQYPDLCKDCGDKMLQCSKCDELYCPDCNDEECPRCSPVTWGDCW